MTQNRLQIVVKPHIDVIDRRVMTTSLAIAEHFGKLHKNVLRDIEALIADCQDAEFNRLNFEPVEYRDAKGEARPAYRLSRDAFSLLAMGFTGKRALEWKLAYLKAFNAMESALAGGPAAKPGGYDFLALFYAMDRSIGAATVLWALLELGASKGWVDVTIRQLIALVGGHISIAAVSNSVKRLKRDGLLDGADQFCGHYRVRCDELDRRIARSRAANPPGLTAADALLEAPETLQ